jgi:hypothetical protein
MTIKTIGVLLAGVFVGAVAVEILNKKSPEFMKKVRKKADNTAKASRKSLNAVKDAFVEGYKEKATQPAT